MSYVQQVSLVEPRLRERQQKRLKGDLQQHEARLLSELFSRNGREEVVQKATPPGYRYAREDPTPVLPVDASGPIMQIAAHPGDGPDFFYATCLKMATNPRYRHIYHEILLTDGEQGVDGWHPERTRLVRIEEAYAGAEIVGSRLHFLGYPDGNLSALATRERARLITRLAQRIGDIQPSILVVHPPKNDHPDHAYSFVLTVAALEINAQAGKKLPTLLIHDVEFGLQQPTICVPQHVNLQMDGYPVYSLDFLVDISSTHQTAQRALHKHRTQMLDPVLGQPKAYADLIDALAQVRGLQFMAEETTPLPQGQGFSHVVIPGVTSEHNILPSRLPAGSLYRRVKQEPGTVETIVAAKEHGCLQRLAHIS